ncbi:MAG: FlgO family outer membrane protein [Myxococcota bacterium]
MLAVALTTLLCAASPKLLVLPIEPRGGVDRVLAENLTASLVDQLRQLGRFQVTALRDVEQALGVEQRRQLAQCDGPSCIAEVAGALNVDELVHGTLGRIGEEYVLSMTRVRARDAVALGAASRRLPVHREAALLDALPGMVTELAPLKTTASPSVALTPASVRSAPFIRIAVLPFDNTSKSGELEPLRKGLADMLITDLKQSARVQLVERERLQEVMHELKLQQSDVVDVRTAQRLGRILGVEYLVMGSFLEVLGQFRLDARLVRVETAEIVAAEGVAGRKEDFMTLERQLVVRMLGRLEVPVTPQEEQLLAQGHSGTLADAVTYGQALDAKDRGDVVTARAKATSIAGRVAPAEAFLRKVEPR